MPIKTTYGYHIIEVTDRREGSLVQFEDAKGSIQSQLMKEKQKTLFEAYLETLKAKSEIKTDEENLTAIKMPWDATE